MTQAAKDYRTSAGCSRRGVGETTLGKYRRVARSEPLLVSGAALPLARPEIACRLSSEEYLALLEVLDELFLLERAARFCDRKPAAIARPRLIRALAMEMELEISLEQLERLFDEVDHGNADLIGPAHHALFPDRPTARGPHVGRADANGGVVLRFKTDA